MNKQEEKKIKNIRKAIILFVCAAALGLVIDLIVRGRQSKPAQAETQIATTSSVAEDNTLPPPQTVAKAETPAPVASGSKSNRVTVDFSGVQPVIK